MLDGIYQPQSWEDRVRHWSGFGWEGIPKHEEGIVRGWTDALSQGGRIRLPGPWRRWDVRCRWTMGTAWHGIEAEFTMKMLAAFRQLIPIGQRMIAIRWQGSWYYFDPHANITTATRDEWAHPMLPDGDSYLFATHDYRFGVLSRWCGKVIVYGRELLAEMERDPPRRFLEVCRFAGGRRLSKPCTGCSTPGTSP